MKSYKHLLIIIFFSFSSMQILCAAPITYLIKGTIRNAPTNSYAKLLRWNGKDYVVKDSCLISKTSFSIKGTADRDEVAFLALSNKRPIPIFLGNDTFFVFGDLSNMSKLQVLGGKEQKIYNGLQAELMEFDYQLNLIDEDYNRASKQYNAQDLLKKIEKDADQLHKQKMASIKKYAQKNITSLAAVYLVSRHLSHLLDVNELELFVSAFEKSGLSKEPLTIQLRSTLNTVQRTSINNPAPNFNLITLKGDTVSLDTYKGKYLLLDFWASWCKPCRTENPNLLALYQKYKNQGFDILGISLDNEKAKWQKAITDDKLPWTQASDLQAWNSEIAKLYNVTAIPNNFLLDTNGIILHKNIKTEELGDVLQNLMQKK